MALGKAKSRFLTIVLFGMTNLKKEREIGRGPKQN